LNNTIDNPGVALLTGFGAIICGDKAHMRRFLADAQTANAIRSTASSMTKKRILVFFIPFPPCLLRKTVR
jgi:hypothetical protein